MHFSFIFPVQLLLSCTIVNETEILAGDDKLLLSNLLSQNQSNPYKFSATEIGRIKKDEDKNTKLNPMLAGKNRMMASMLSQEEEQEEKGSLSEKLSFMKKYGKKINDDFEKMQILKQSVNFEITRLSQKEEYLAIFGQDGMENIRKCYLECVETSVFMTRDQFMSCMGSLNNIYNPKILDKMFMFILKSRSKVLAPKIPMNCISFSEVVDNQEHLTVSNPYRIFNCISFGLVHF